MIFIRYNNDDGSSVLFSLDQIATLDQTTNGIEIVLMNERIIDFPIDIDDFCAKVFSDENYINEYMLIEFDGNKPIVTDLLGTVQ